MQDEVKLIYLYQLGAEGFRSGDNIDHPKYVDTIIKVTGDLHKEYLAQYRMQNLTPQVMAKIMLSWLCKGGNI